MEEENLPLSPLAPTAPATPLDPALLPALAAVSRALEEDFQPAAFLDGLHPELNPLVPHERLAILCFEEDRRSFSVFAEHGSPALLPDGRHYACDLERVARFSTDGSPLALICDGEGLFAPDVLADLRFATDADTWRAGGLRSMLLAPLRAGNRLLGAIMAASQTPGVYEAAQLDRLEALGRLIGPLVETVAKLYRERRRQHRVELLKGITQRLGISLDVRQMLESVGNAIHPAVSFDTMGVILFKSEGAEYVLFGTVGEAPVAGVESIPTTEFSYAPAVMAGQPVLFQEASKQLDPARAGDRAMLTADLQSLLFVPMHFGDPIGGVLFFGKHEPRWYDGVDIEVATMIASAMVLAIQHQRLAEEQRRRSSVERRAQTLEHSLRSARTQLHDRYDFSQILGPSPLLREALARAAQVAATETTVLITGESGTGKELVARAIHHASPRAEGPYVAVNSAALPETLLESELFGHERGAFTGADRQKLGRFELAAGGTLFLDEIGDLSPAVQAKLLRVLQEHEFQRVGGTTTIKADVRLVTATNRDLTADMASGRFRSDLFYRLSVFNVHLPPLRERAEDVLLLADHFIRTLGAHMGKGDLTLSRDAREVLLHHPWPGNIRELQNAIERALITSEGALITAAHLALPAAPPPAVPPPTTAPQPADSPAPAPQSLEELERAAIIEALRATNGHKERAAARLGLSRFQFYNRLKRYGIAVTFE